MKKELEKEYLKAMGNFFLTLWFGWFGVHKFIKKDFTMGLVYLFTLGLFGIGWIIDIIKSIADVMRKYKRYQNPRSSTNNVSNEKILANNLKKENIIEKLNNGESYQVKTSSDPCVIYPTYLEIKKYGCITTKITYDENNLTEFNLEKVEVEFKGYYNVLNIHYFKNLSSNYSSLEIISFKPEENSNMEQIAEYLNSKAECRSKYAEEQKIKKQQEEQERKFGKNRYSKTKFTYIDDNMYLKYSYYDVEVKGSQYENFDISKIPIDEDLKFEFEPTNEYDKNAIKVICNNIAIGYVPKNTIQEMVKNYLEDDDKYVEAFISKVNENEKHIEMAIGFYKELDEYELKNVPHIDATLIKTTKKDEYGESRQDSLSCVSEGDEVDIDYDCETETYIVTSIGSELGEINKNKSETLQEYEMENKEFYSIILELNDDSDTISCKVRIFIIDC